MFWKGVYSCSPGSHTPQTDRLVNPVTATPVTLFRTGPPSLSFPPLFPSRYNQKLCVVSTSSQGFRPIPTFPPFRRGCTETDSEGSETSTPGRQKGSTLDEEKSSSEVPPKVHTGTGRRATKRRTDRSREKLLEENGV